MGDAFKTVQVWVGRFPTEDRFAKYIGESYSEDSESDHLPISEFASDQGGMYYDHDFMEARFLHEATGDLRDLVGPHSFSSSYLER
jgi:hypothetical protein